MRLTTEAMNLGDSFLTIWPECDPQHVRVSSVLFFVSRHLRSAGRHVQNIFGSKQDGILRMDSR